MKIIYNKNKVKKALVKFEQINNTPIKMLNFPLIRQIHDYDCGVSSLQSVLVYYGLEKKEDELIELLKPRHTEIFNNGTKFSDIKKVSEKLGFKCEIHEDFTIDEIINCIDNKIPVIVLIQAYQDKSIKFDSDFNDGHYIVAVGYNESKLFFEDPSSFNRAFLTKKEFLNRWHGRNDENKIGVIHEAIIIYGTPKFDINKITHID